MVKIAFALVALLYMQCASALTQVTASVDKNPVMLNESLILTVVANDQLNTKEFDSSSLLRDFIVGRTSSSSQTSIVNGKATRTTSWTTLLMPRVTGKFVIPAFTLQQLRTQPINIDVIAPTAGDGKEAQKIFITSSLSSAEVYVQELTTLTVKLHFSVDLNRGALSDPTLSDANISQIGEDKEGSDIIKGIRYRTIERTYAINPQKSGTYTLASSYFEGEVISANRRRSSFFNVNETQPIRVRGDNLSITVKPIPVNVEGDWLPSELVTLHQEWQPALSEFKVGEPITRVLTLTAASLSEEQLPELIMPVPKGLKAYPDQAQLHSRVNNAHLVSQKIQNFALVASKPGDYTLPEIKVAWWNTVTNKMQHALLPAQKVTVHKNEDWQESAVVTAEVTPLSETPVSGASSLIAVTTPWLQWLFLGLWLATSIAWYLSSRRMKKALLANDSDQKSASPLKKINNENVSKALLKACKAHQGEQALALIIPWLNQQNKDIMTLDDALSFIDDTAFSNAVLELQACYFGKIPQTWNGDNLHKVLITISQSPKNNSVAGFALNP